MGPPPGPGAAPAGGPRRRGTPKIVPVVVSAGLAVGTFCGLLFGVGTGGGSGTAGAAPGSDAGAVAVAATDAGAVAAAAIDAAPPPPDAGAGIVQIDAAPAAVKVVLTFKVVPAVPTEITVDGEKVEGNTFEVVLEDGARTVKIVAKARGFRTHEKEFAVTKDMVVPIALKKRADGPSPQGPSGPIIDL